MAKSAEDLQKYKKAASPRAELQISCSLCGLCGHLFVNKILIKVSNFK